MALPIRKWAFYALLGFACSASAQLPKEVYQAYDASTGPENLNLNNGKGYPNPYIVKKGNHQFYRTNEYTSSTVVYDGQPYYGVALKYDIYHDILVYLPKNTENNIGTILEKTSVSSFEIDGKKFVNLDNLDPKPENVNGYYQIVYEGKRLILFCKQHKFRREKHGTSSVYEEFTNEPTFIMLANGKYSKANSRGDIASLFPDQKDRIRDFYRKDKNLQKDNPEAFMESLARFIDNYSNQ